MYRIAFSDNQKKPTFLVGFFVFITTLLLITTRDLWVGIACLLLMFVLFYHTWREVEAASIDAGILLLYNNGDIEICIAGEYWHCQLHKHSQVFAGVMLLKLTGFERAWLVMYSSSLSAVDNARLRRHVIEQLKH